MMGWYELDSSGSGWMTLVNNGKETSGSIKCWQVLGLLQNWRPLKKGSAPCSYLFTRASNNSIYIALLVITKSETMGH
jgi:hypothetical protein